MNNIIDDKIKQGFDKQIAEALCFYFKIEPSQVRVENDDTSQKHTLLFLYGIDPKQTRASLRLTELGRHLKAHLHYKEDHIMIRIEDEIIDAFTEKQLAKKAKKA